MITSGNRQNPKTHFIADRRLYLDAEGKVVEADDPTRTSLLAAEGTGIPLARARELGLTNDSQASASEASASESSEKKQQKKASNKSAPKSENKSG